MRKLFATTWSSAGTGVALVASIVALAFTLEPSLAPDPGAGLVATIAVRTVEPGVSLSGYDKQFEPGNLAHDLAAFDANHQHGDVVWVSIEVHGKKHGHVKLYAVPYYTRTKRVTSIALARAETTDNARGFNPGTPDDQWIAPLWVANPSDDYFVRVMLEADGVILAYVDTPTIKGI